LRYVDEAERWLEVVFSEDTGRIFSETWLLLAEGNKVGTGGIHAGEPPPPATLMKPPPPPPFCLLMSSNTNANQTYSTHTTTHEGTCAFFSLSFLMTTLPLFSLSRSTNKRDRDCRRFLLTTK
jgi:hypothetical protein